MRALAFALVGCWMHVRAWFTPRRRPNPYAMARVDDAAQRKAAEEANRRRRAARALAEAETDTDPMGLPSIPDTSRWAVPAQEILVIDEAGGSTDPQPRPVLADALGFQPDMLLGGYDGPSLATMIAAAEALDLAPIVATMDAPTELACATADSPVPCEAFDGVGSFDTGGCDTSGGD